MALLFFILQISAFPAHAQVQITGTIAGTIQDSSGASVSNALVIIVNQDTGVSTSVRSSGTGNYTAPYLPAGTYRITVDAQGFLSAVAPNNLLSSGQTVRVDVKLQVGTVSQSVEVSGASPLIQTATSDTSAILDERQLMDIPLNGNVFSQAVNTLPGTQPAGFTNNYEVAAGTGAQTPIQSSVNGVPFEGVQYYLDGVSDQEPLNSYINITPSMDSIQEMKIEMNTPSAANGAYGGALVSVIMKSGTNQLHGSAFEFFRNDSLNATPNFAITKPPFRSNQFGVSVGGPIIRNRAFFFGDYQGTQFTDGQVFTAFVPTALLRQGIFSPTEGFSTIYDPTTGNPFPNGQIPMSRWDPVARAALITQNLWPIPNVNVGQNLTTIPFNYESIGSQEQPVNQFDIKGEYQFADSSRLFVRESYVHRDLTAPLFGSEFLYGLGDQNSQSRDHNAVVGYDRAFSPNLFMELRLGFQRFSTQVHGNDYGTDENTTLGIANGTLMSNPETTGVADFATEFADLGAGAFGGTPELRLFNDYQINGTVTRVLGKHNFSFGADLRRNESTLTGPAEDGSGYFSFSGNYTSNGNFTTGTPTGGDRFADFLLGDPTFVERGFVGTAPAVRFPWMGYFAQDDWRVSKQLTLNLGLRYDRFSEPYERHNHQSNFDPTTGLMVIAQPGNRVPDVNTFDTGFAPRIGAAYSPNSGRTSLRSAFGLDYFNDNFGATDGTLEENFPFFQTFDEISPTLYNPFWSLSSNGLPAPSPAPNTPTVVPGSGTVVYNVPTNFHPDSLAMWNVGIQQQLMPNLALEMNYVGNHGYHLFRTLPIDTPFTPGPGAIAPRSPFYSVAPQISGVNERDGNGDSHYHALQVQLTKQFSHGLWAKAAYTWSHYLNDVNVIWPYSNTFNYGPADSNFSGADIRNNFVASYGYNLPFGRGLRFLSNAPFLVNEFLGNWTLSGTAMLESGLPLEITVETSLLNTGTPNLANKTCTHAKTFGQLSQWFDTSCFSEPAPYTLGNSGEAGAAIGPDLIDFDSSLNKKFMLEGNRSIGIRIDAFDVFNHAQLNEPITTLGALNFGQVTSLNPNYPITRQLQLSAHFAF